MKKNVKHTATISLAIMGAGFAAMFPFDHLPFGFILQSGFEAGLVGGLADWFAVTALFRHPLGIPIPHTALLPRNREKVTNALVRAIQTNLLHKESIIGKMKEARIVERLTARALEELARDEAGVKIASVLAKAAEAVPRDSAANALADMAREAISGADVRKLLDRIGKSAADRRLAEPLLDYALEQGTSFAASDELRRRMGALALQSLDRLRLGGLMGFAMNAFAGFMNEDKLGGMLQEFLIGFLYEMRHDGNPYRETALRAIRDAMRGLGENERLAAEAERLKASLSAPADGMDDPVAAFARKTIDALLGKLSEPRFCEETIVPFLRSALTHVTERTGAVQTAEEWVRRQAAVWIENNHDAIGRLVKENADKLGDAELIAMMEEHVGKDLQWIRVNGAVCGFAIGIVLGSLQVLTG